MSFVDPHRFTNATIRGEPASPTMFPRKLDSSSRPCYCGGRVDSRGGIYCSIDCARGDAFSSLTHARNGSSSSSRSSYADERYSRAPSAEYDDAAHYRRMKRDERRELDRIRRVDRDRGEGSLSPVSTRSPSAVPDLVSSHSRSTSTASSVFSLASSSSLSRNPSTSSRNAYTASVAIDDAIMEVMEVDYDEAASARSTLKARHRGLDKAAPLPEQPKFGVNDMLDEIINMEESFRVPDDELQTPSTPTEEEFVPTFFRPPRTPSPVLGKRGSMVPPAPNAPDRRGSFIGRPQSIYAHQSSLSESHTALYLATASPMAPSKSRHRRSASPQLNVRRSITFTPQAAGPSLARPLRARDSPGLTPVRRKHLTPNAHHPPMQGWRFPTSSNVTPTRGAREADTVPQLLWPAEGASSEASHEPRLSPPSSALRLGRLMMDDDDDAATIRGSRQSLAAPAPPFAQPGW